MHYFIRIAYKREQCNIHDCNNMKNITEFCTKFFDDEDTRKGIKQIISPVGNIIYNEIYAYIWVICFYNIFLFIIVLANMYILLKIMKYIKNVRIYIND